MTKLLVPEIKKNSKGLPVYVVPLILFSDDSSGNRSKKWNKFDNWAIILAGLPKKENARIENIHLVAASNKVTAIEMCEPIAEDLKVLDEKGMVVHDAATGQDVMIYAPVICIICDNSRASELVNHRGSAANKYCRICQVEK